ncbi:hypothetical protein, partial [Frankia sp. Cr1]|uniref:hypothetical protein n=1 Tax=Frankia sp. Cr1 TaxID=3073931 RepID=UPI002AD4ABF2
DATGGLGVRGLHQHGELAQEQLGILHHSQKVELFLQPGGHDRLGDLVPQWPTTCEHVMAVALMAARLTVVGDCLVTRVR